MSAPGAAALVGFVDSTQLWWLRLLRPGFRHCFVAVRQDGVWMVVDPLSHTTRLHVETIADLAGFYRRHGVVVVATTVQPPPCRPLPWRPHSCVEVVKRVLGLRASWVFTPHQLHSYLIKRKKYLDSLAPIGYTN